MKLTDATLRALPAPDKGQRDYPDDLIPGLSVRVSQGGTKTFSLIVRGATRERVTIGRYPIIDLADARTTEADARAAMLIYLIENKLVAT